MAATATVTLSQGNFENFARMFRAADSDAEKKLQIATEIRDQIEIVHTQEYQHFLPNMMPEFMHVLVDSPPVMSETTEQKIRNTVLEIINRLPNNDTLKPYAQPLLVTMMNLLKVENEDNAVICLRIIIDLHKNFRAALENEVQPFLDIVQLIYQELPNTVTQIFSEPASTSASQSMLNVPSAPGSADDDKADMIVEQSRPKSQVLIPAMKSFKVLTECPIIVVLLFQLYPKEERFVSHNIPLFVPLIVNTLGLKTPLEAKDTNRQAFIDFIGAQVKTLSFLAYILRGFSEHLKPHMKQIPRHVIQLLLNCPAESATIRKELLIATRHILATDFRSGFIGQIDVLLDEKVLIGTGRTSYETLRPLAHSTLADLVHHIRGDLSVDQLSRTIYLYSRNIHDPTLPLSIQTMSGKLLLNLVECIVRKNDDAGRGRTLLIRILDTFVNKFETLKDYIPLLIRAFEITTSKSKMKGYREDMGIDELEAADQKNKETAEAEPAEGATAMEVDAGEGAKESDEKVKEKEKEKEKDKKDISHLLLQEPIRTSVNTEGTVDSIKDCRLLMKTLVLGLKTIVWGIVTCSNRPPAAQPAAPNQPPPPPKSPALSEAEAGIFVKLLRMALPCFAIYGVQVAGTSSTEEKEIMDHFASVFTMIDPRAFQEVFTGNINALFQSFLDNQTILTIPQHFLANPAVSKYFADILLNFLVGHLKTLGGNDKTASGVLLRLFKLVFGSVTLFPDNEPVLQPHLRPIVNSSMTMAAEVKDPLSYFLLLRALFRSIGGGKFELLYMEFLPLLPVLLEGLNRLQRSSHKQTMRDLFVELCLTVPVRLSALLPYLHFLMRPLVLALQAGVELVAQGLRTLELCVDNLTPDFLDPIMAPVRTDLMTALWRHLRPLPYPHGPHALRILGKLGGRNRRFLKEPTVLNYKANIDEGLTMEFNFEGRPPFTMPLDMVVDLAKQSLLSSQDAHFRRQAYELVRVCLVTMMNLDFDPTHYAYPVDSLQHIPQSEGSTAPKNKSHHSAESRTFKVLLICSFVAIADNDLKEEAKKFALGVCNHYALLTPPPASKPVVAGKDANSMDIVEKKEVDFSVFAEAIVALLTAENRDWSNASLLVLEEFWATTVALAGSEEKAAEHPIFADVARRFAHCCYQRNWYRKSGGCAGVNFLANKMPTSWVERHQLEFIRALLFVLSALPRDLAVGTIEEASTVLALVLRKCNKPVAGDAGKRRDTEVLQVLVQELTSPNATVRKAIQESFQLLADISVHEVTDVIDPVKGLLPFFQKQAQLRQMTYAGQIGFIEGLTYCLSLRPPFLVYQPDELLRILTDALAITEAEDTSLVKMPSYKKAKSLIPLRKSCLELLSSAVTSSTFQVNEGPAADLRNRIIAVFFKALTAGVKELVEVAKVGLTQVIQQSKLPKELLQSSLRPVLLNLADHKKLSVPLLQGLARLLELLTHCFNVTLGEKLLEHVKKWAEPQQQPKPQGNARSQNSNFQVAAAILDVFHLLPPAASRFLEPLVKLIQDLESLLPVDVVSPYRAPLTKFLNHYPVDAIEYFLPYLAAQPMARLFQSIVSSELAGPLREELARNPGRLIEKLTTGLQEAQFQTIVLVHTLVQHIPDWLVQHRPVVEALLQVWLSQQRQARLLNEEAQQLEHLRESRYLVECFLNYCTHNRNEVDLLFQMMTIFTVRTVVDYTFLKWFYLKQVAEGSTLDQRKAIMNRFLTLFSDPVISQSHKVQMLQLMIIPMLTHSLQQGNGGEILSETVVRTIVERLLGSSSTEDANTHPNHDFDDALRIQLLQLAALLVRYTPESLVVYRRELIKFAWLHLRSEDATAKHCGYVLVCRFIEAYDTPPRVILQVYVALLRAYQTETRTLVKQALDILTPSLPKRLPAGDHRYAMWIKWTKKIVIEEGHSLPQLIHIWQLVARHPHLFFPARGQFTPQMVNSLARIGLPASSQLDSRKLSVDLAEVIVDWEEQAQKLRANPPPAPVPEPTPMEEVQEEVKESKPARRGGRKRGAPEPEEQPEAKRPPPTTPAAAAAGAVAPREAGFVDDFVPNALIIEMVINFLVRVPCAAPESRDASGASASTGIAARCLNLLRRLYGIWPSASMKLNFFDKIFSAPEPNVILTGLDILSVVLDHQLASFGGEQLAELEAALFRPLATDQAPVMTSACAVLDKVMERFPLVPAGTPTGATPAPAPAAAPTNQAPDASGAVPMDVSTPTAAAAPTNPTVPPGTLPQVASFYLRLDQIIKTAVDSAKNIPCTVILVDVVGRRHPPLVDVNLNGVVKLLHNLVKDHLTPPPAPPPPPQPAGQPPQQPAPPPPKPDSGPLRTLIQLLSLRFEALGEHRRTFLMLITALVEKSLDTPLLEDIISLVRRWLQLNDNSAPNLKEKANLLFKLLSLESSAHAPSVHTNFLLLTHHVYDTPAYRRTELTMKMEPGFMMGLRAHDASVRKKFFEIFNGSINRAVQARLHYVLTVQNWDSLKTTFWIKQAVDIIMAVVRLDKAPALPAGSAKLPAPAASARAVNHPEPIKQLLAKHEAFLNEARGMRVSHLVESLRELCHQNSQMAHYLWVRLFPVAWATLTTEEQDREKKAMTVLLSKTYHLHQASNTPNVVQAILEGLSRADPPVRLPVDVVKYLAKTFNAWHIVIPVFERYTQHDDNDPDAAKTREQSFEALGELYNTLNESDAFFGLQSRRPLRPDSKAALSFEQHGLFTKANEIFFAAMQKAAPTLASDTGTPPAPAELNLWEEHWLSCARQLNQWDLLSEWAVSADQPQTLLECAWKSGQWPVCRELLSTLGSTPDTPQKKLYQVYVAVQDQREVEKLSQEGVQLCLQKWCSLPEVVGAAHIPLLQQFQQFVELTESCNILMNLANTQNNHQTLPELKGLLNTWRERLPNPWDDIFVWNELLTWRHHVFSAINQVYAPMTEVNNNLAYMGFHEMAWTINRFAHVARKHGLLDVCLNALAKIYQLPNIEIQDAFVKLKEQAKCYFHLTPELRTGLDIINSTNLDYFGPQQKAEFFQLKGEFLHRMGYADEASSAFATAVQLYESLGKAWASWGAYLDDQFMEHRTHIEHAEKALTAYLMAASCHPREWIARYVARLLFLLTFETPERTLGKVFEQYSPNVPTWLWIAWLPQLIAGLYRNDTCQLFKPVMLRVGLEFPQALYAPMRTCLLDLREQYNNQLQAAQLHQQQQAMQAQAAAGAAAAAAAAGASTPGAVRPSTPPHVAPGAPGTPGLASTVPPSPGGPTPMEGVTPTAQPTPTMAVAQLPTPVQAQQRVPPPQLAVSIELMQQMKSAHFLHVSDLEAIAEELCARFKPEPEEELLRIAHALLSECQQVPPATSAQPLPANLVHVIERIKRQFFQTQPKGKPTSFVTQYKAEFEADFETTNMTFESMEQKIRAWLPRLTAEAEALAATENLEELSPILAKFENSEVEIPGQHFDDRAEFCTEPVGEHVRLERFHSEVTVVRRHHTSCRRIVYRGENGKLYPFLVQHASLKQARTEERMMQLLRIVNSVLSHGKETRARHAAFHVPAVITLSPTVRIVQDDVSYTSLEDIYVNDCKEKNRAPDAPALHFKELMRQRQSEGPAGKLRTYTEIASTMVSPHLLADFLQRSFAAPAHLWVFKKKFATQLAMISLIGHLMVSPARAPHRLLFALNTGEIMPTEINSGFNKRGLLELEEKVPFRLTPNLTTALGPSIIDGVFSAVMLAGARVLGEQKTKLRHFLNVYLRDELYQWRDWQVAAGGDPGLRPVEWLTEAVHTNTETIMKRVHASADTPESGREPIAINKHVNMLISVATDKTYLASMDAPWHPWL